MQRLRAVLFDMDGTVFRSEVDLDALRRRVGLRRDGRAFLDQLADLDADGRATGLALLQAEEKAAAERAQLAPGASEVLSGLRRCGVACGLVTNNSRTSADVMLGRFPLPFDLVLTRDDVATKPDPAGLLSALKRFGVSAEQAAAIGDAHLDLLAAHRAGIAQILLVGEGAFPEDILPRDLKFHRARDLFQAWELLSPRVGGRRVHRAP